MNVALVSVGDELLSGDTVNTNAAWLGQRLTERGASVARVTVVPDRVADIARVVNEYAADHDAVIVTGGIGPTHDDKTMEGVAAAVGRPLAKNEAALEWLEAAGGYAREDLTEGTTTLPEDAEPLHNTEGVAPGCHVENIYVLPGVPTEMKAMFDGVADDFDGEPPHVGYVAVDEPESQLVDRLEELQERFAVTVGSYPGEYVRVKIQSTDASAVNAAMAWLQNRVDVEASE